MTKAQVVAVATGLPRPQWRGRIHTWAFWATIPAVLALLFIVDQPLARVGAAVFGLSKLTLYGVSAAYHRLAHGERAQRIMRRLDHSMIFVLIAGTYTPVCLVALPDPWRFILLGLVWTIAVVGVAIKVLGSDWLLSRSNFLYIAMGWLGIVALPLMIHHLSPLALGFMFTGGALYTVGALLFYRRLPDPSPLVFGYHEIWHGFTVLAGAAHYTMVALVVGS